MTSNQTDFPDKGSSSRNLHIGRMNYGGHVYESFGPALATTEQWQAVQALNFERPAKGWSHPKGKVHQKSGTTSFVRLVPVSVLSSQCPRGHRQT